MIFANTGVNVETVEKKLSMVDGAVVGTTFKIDGVFENHVDPDRVKIFMDKVSRVLEKNSIPRKYAGFPCKYRGVCLFGKLARWIMKTHEGTAV